MSNKNIYKLLNNLTMNARIFTTLFLFVVGLSWAVSAQTDIVGKWKTIDDKSGKAKSVVEIYQGPNGKYYGKIEKLYVEPGEDANPKCTECKGAKKDQQIIGMIIISGLEKTGSNMWRRGEILDPANGNVYDCKMWIEKGNLQVRGYLGVSLVGRSQTWLPYK